MAKFWTSADTVPYQKHNFEVDLDLYYIRSRYYNRLLTGNLSADEFRALAAAAKEPGSNKRYIANAGYKKLGLYIKSVDLPNLQVSLVNQASKNEPDYEAEAPEYRNLTLTFYGHRNVIRYIPQIFYAYWINPTTGMPGLLVNKSAATTEVNKKMRDRSRVTVRLFNNVEGQNRNIIYTRLVPVGFDLGDLTYESSDILEAKMEFAFNLSDGPPTGGDGSG